MGNWVFFTPISGVMRPLLTTGVPGPTLNGFLIGDGKNLQTLPPGSLTPNAPEKCCLEDDPFLLGFSNFSEAMLNFGRVNKKKYGPNQSLQYYRGSRVSRIPASKDGALGYHVGVSDKISPEEKRPGKKQVGDKLTPCNPKKRAEEHRSSATKKDRHWFHQAEAQSLPEAASHLAPFPL